MLSFEKPKDSKSEKQHVFQESKEELRNVFQIGRYKTLETYLTFLGLNPYQDDRTSSIIVISILIVYSSVCYPATVNFYNTVREKNYDGIFVDLPQLMAGTASILKLLNVYSNKSRFRELFEFIVFERELLTSEDELRILDEFTERGNRLAQMYRRTLLIFLMLFVSVPLRNPFLDIILPLNETRPRQHIFRVDYIFLDEFEYFYPVYAHLSCIAITVVVMIIVVDSLYISVIHHACGMFTVCGHIVLKATENSGEERNGSDAEKFRRCVAMHHEALQFFEILDRCCRNLYLIQMGLNMIALSVTAVELILFLGRPGDALRTACFLTAQYFHLYAVNLPGQILLDQSTELTDKIFASNWYDIPVKMQKVLYTMQIRSKKPCTLTAAGLFQMNIESFGATVKTCASYFTMFLSLRE